MSGVARFGRRLRVEHVERLLEADVPVQIVAPVAGRAPQPLALDEPRETLAERLALRLRQGERRVDVDAGGEEEGDGCRAPPHPAA